MKSFNWTLLSLAVFAITSCGNRPSAFNKDYVTPVDSSIPFQGEWVKEEYINKLLETHSPHEAQGSEFFLVIPDSIGKEGGTYVFHEGGGNFTIQKSGESYLLWYEGRENGEHISIITDKKIEVGNETYVKVTSGLGLPETILFKGMYTFNDTTVELTANGEIKGLSIPVTYLVMTDYIGPGYGEFDIVDIRTQSDTSMCAFRFSADTLFIHETECHETDEYGTCLDVQRARLKYMFIKKK